MIARKKTKVNLEGTHITPTYETPDPSHDDENAELGPRRGFDSNPRQVQGRTQHLPHRRGKPIPRHSKRGIHGGPTNRSVSSGYPDTMPPGPDRTASTGRLRSPSGHYGTHEMSSSEERGGSSSNERPFTRHGAGHPQDIRGAHGGGRSPQPPKSSVNKPAVDHRKPAHMAPSVLHRNRRVDPYKLRSFGGLTTW